MTRPHLCVSVSAPKNRTMQSVPYLGHTIRRWQIGDSTFLAWPEQGARLMHWHHERADGSLREVLHWPELTEAELTDTTVAKVRGGNPVLFPFNARVFDAGEIHFWQDPAGTRRAMPMHGFARQGTFRLEKIDDHGFIAVLEPTTADALVYPFDYTFSVKYRFHRRRFTVEFALENHGEEPIPWSAGHHFYFAAPWTDQQTRDDYVIELPAGDTVRQGPDGLLGPGPQLPRRCRLSAPDLVDAIHVNLAGNAVRFGPIDGSEQVTVTLGTENPPAPDAAFVTWTAAPDVPYYCVEPWMGPPNAPGHGRGLHWVAPGATGRFAVEVAIS